MKEEAWLFLPKKSLVQRINLKEICGYAIVRYEEKKQAKGK